TTGQELLTVRGAGGGSGLSFSPDGRRLATANGPLKVWDVTVGQDAVILPAFTQPAYLDVAYTPDGSHVAGVGYVFKGRDYEPQLKLWETKTWKETATLRLPGAPGAQFEWCVAFSPNGKQLAVPNGNAVK